MFDFDEDKLTDDQVMEVARQDNLPPLRVAINANGYRQSFKFWPSAEEMLCVKLSYKYGVVVHKIKHLCGNTGMLYVSQLYRQIREVQPFVGRDDIFNDLSNIILPSLQDAGITCRIGDQVFAHPYLVEMDERDVYRWCSQYLSDAPSSHYVRPQTTIHGYDADEVEKAIQFYRKAKALLNGE
ncbi:hypothetical protein [Escherichia phage e4/1c]|uniref:Uncharacterized protein n=1 Tax=Escherichia phage e4/1c TaxID=1495286 RepID=A0A023ZUF8_9CAUD|nr:hypothetical protein e41c_0064 [Escherichia phage e4/1c]AHY83214.1 hypothetical protein [Escherichia phage e4/1c]